MAAIRIEGENFNVDDFLSESRLVPEFVFRRGRPLDLPVKKSRVAKKSGFIVNIGGEFGKLSSQSDETCKFVEMWRAELERLEQYPGVTEVRVIFSYRPGVKANVTERFSLKLLSALSLVGASLELDVYPGVGG